MKEVYQLDILNDGEKTTILFDTKEAAEKTAMFFNDNFVGEMEFKFIVNDVYNEESISEYLFNVVQDKLQNQCKQH